ncbi:MAG TPA: hypothetical protein VGB89_13645, partial [Bacteroidota bacterium]
AISPMSSPTRIQALFQTSVMLGRKNQLHWSSLSAITFDTWNTTLTNYFQAMTRGSASGGSSSEQVPGESKDGNPMY